MSNLNPQKDPRILFERAFYLQQNGDLRDAEILYRNVLEIAPSHIGAKSMLGTIFVQSGRDSEGIKLIESSLSKDPKQFWAHNTLGVGFLNTKQYKKAFLSFNNAIAINPNYIDAHFNLGKSQRALEKYEDAIISYSKCIALNQKFLDAYSNRGNIYLENLKNYDKAMSDFLHVTKLAPDLWFGFYNLGNAQKELKYYESALESYERAIQLKTDLPDVYVNIGTVYMEIGSYDEALKYYERALQLKPNFAEAYLNIGAIYGKLKQYDEAMLNLDQAMKINPNTDYLLGNFLHTKMQLCDWKSYDQLYDILRNKIDNQERAAYPFEALGLTDDPLIQKQVAETYAKDKYPVGNTSAIFGDYPKNEKIRIGYFSADFHNHPMMHLMSELFELHDRSRFEVIAFSFGPDSDDYWRKRAISAFDQFIDVQSKTDHEIVLLARELKIDIAIDRKGYTENARMGLFAERLAPIQVSYLAYPGTVGNKYIDYIIADHILIPEDKQQYYSEKIVYLPNSYLVNIRDRVISEKVFTREQMGLPENAFVFCSFNNNYKITPKTFDSWMNILKLVEGSVLWIFKSNETAAKNLKKEAELRGITSARLIFAPFMPAEEHLKRIQLADLFLDTLPYNAHTTASDALRVGLPIITMIGESFAGRVAASLLNAMGLNELITITQEEYQSLAIELATTPLKLQAIKEKLISNLATSSLFNSELFTQHIEAAYQIMYQQHQDHLAPSNIYIQNFV